MYVCRDVFMYVCIKDSIIALTISVTQALWAVYVC